MIQTLKCKKCSNQIKIDYSKAPKEEFLIGCPSCKQKYKLKKPVERTETESTNKAKDIKINFKTIPCPKCKSNLNIDFSRITKFPAIVSCQKCSTKLKINDPEKKNNLSKNNLDKLKTGTPQVKFDPSKIDPKNNWAYKLYYYTKSIIYLNKLTLIIYLLYLIRSLSKTISEIKIEKINQETFAKIRAEVNGISSNIFNSVINPILLENEISPKLLSWATNWFVKKLSSRIVMNILNKTDVDESLPFVKKFKEEVRNENSRIIKIFTNQYAILLYFIILLFPLTIKEFYWIDEIQSKLIILLLAILPILLSHYNKFYRTKRVFIGILSFWILLVLFPSNYKLYEIFFQSNVSFTEEENSLIFRAREALAYLSESLQYFIISISILALAIDYFESIGRRFAFADRLSGGFKSSVVSLLVLVPFVILTMYNYTSKHYVTVDELNLFKEKNTKFQGSWIYLNGDSTSFSEIFINTEVSVGSRVDAYGNRIESVQVGTEENPSPSADEKKYLENYVGSGNIGLKLDLMLIENWEEHVYYSNFRQLPTEVKSAKAFYLEDYDDKISFPIIFSDLFEIKSIDDKNMKGVIKDSNGKEVSVWAKRPDYWLENYNLPASDIENLRARLEYNNQ